MKHTEKMTERQAAALPGLIDRAKQSGACISGTPYGWVMEWAEEVRRGRGRDLNALWTDGEHFVQIMMDVYGGGTVSIAELNWIHSDSDEECPCDLCTEERDRESNGSGS